MINQDKLEDLLKQYVEGRIGRDDFDLLFEYIRKNHGDVSLDTITDRVFEEMKSYNPLNKTDRELIYQRIIRDKRFEVSGNNVKSLSGSVSKIRYRIGIAASLLILLSAGMYFYREHTPGNKTTPVSELVRPSVIKPGGDKAILTLSDGSRIILDSAKNGVLANQAGVSIQKTSDGELQYSFLDPLSKKMTGEIIYNKIETPAGGKYQINLPDGSKVWLNSSSSLRYPALFVGNTREVELTGEAFFDIAKDKKKPFKVITRDQVVEVLGTQFNINSYYDGDDINTTLIEGSVKIFYKDKVVLLSPGQQFRPAETNTRVVEADTEEVVAWKNGFFLFKNENIQSIMRKLSRWYDVEVVYEGKIPAVGFGGNISRSKEISEVLDVLQLTNAVHFKIEGRRITVMP